MVEVALVHIETINAHRHVVAILALVVGRFCVHHPLVARCGDGNVTSRRHEMGRELYRDRTLWIIRFKEIDTDVFIVEVTSCIHLYLFRDHLTSLHEHGIARTVQGVTAKEHLGSLLVQFIRYTKIENLRSSVGKRTLVHHVDGVAGWLSIRHVRNDALVCPDAQLINLNGLLVIHGARTIVLRLALILPRLAGRTTVGPEDEVAIDFFIIAGIACWRKSTINHLIQRIVDVLQEHVCISLRYCIINLLFVHLRAIHADVVVGTGCCAQREASFLRPRLRLSVLVVEINGKYRLYLERNLGTHAWIDTDSSIRMF